MSISKSFVILPLSLLGAGVISFSGITFFKNMKNSYSSIPSNSTNNYKNSIIPQISSNSNSLLHLSSPLIVTDKTNLTKFNFSEVREFNLNLDLEKSKKLLDFPNKLDIKEEKKINTSVGEIFSEIKKESGTIDIRRELSEKIKESEKVLKDHYESFNKAFQSIKNWSKGMEAFKDINKSHQNLQDLIQNLSSIEKLNPLVKKDKESLIIFYKEFFKLVKSKQEMVNKFSTLTEAYIEEKEEIQKISKNSDKVLKALEEIGWTQEKSLDEKINKLLEKSSFYENNSFFFLLKKEEWQMLKEYAVDIKRSQEERKANSIIQEMCFFTSIAIWWEGDHCYGNLKELNRKKDTIEYSLDWRIGSKLLHDMQQAEEITGLILKQQRK